MSRQDSSFLCQSVATSLPQVNSTDNLVWASVFPLAAELGEGQTLLNTGATLPGSCPSCSSLGVGKSE